MDLPFSLSFHLSERPLLFFLTQVSIYHTPASEQWPEVEEEGGALAQVSGQHLWQQLPSNPSIFLDLTPSFQKYLHLFSSSITSITSPFLMVSDDLHPSQRKQQEGTHSPFCLQPHPPVLTRTLTYAPPSS